MDYTSQTWRVFFEALPIIAAIITIVISANRAITTYSNRTRMIAFLYVMCAMLLIFAQASWSWTMFIKKDINGSDIANILWTTFNMLTMFSMSYTIREEVQ